MQARHFFVHVNAVRPGELIIEQFLNPSPVRDEGFAAANGVLGARAEAQRRGLIYQAAMSRWFHTNAATPLYDELRRAMKDKVTKLESQPTVQVACAPYALNSQGVGALLNDAD